MIRVLIILFLFKYVHCNHYVLCKEDKNCNNQLWPNDSENNTLKSCYAEHYYNDTTCYNELSNALQTYRDNDQWQMEIIPHLSYKEDNLLRTILKISLYNVTKGFVTIKFTQSNYFCMRVDINITADVALPNSLDFDCHWGVLSEIEGYPGLLEYSVNHKKRTYNLVVPYHNYIKNFDTEDKSKLSLYLYVDNTQNDVILKIRTAPKHLNITHYCIKINNENGTEYEILAENAKNEVLEFSYNIGGSGKYKFLVKPCNCDCDLYNYSVSPEISVYKLNESILMICIVAPVTLLIPIFLLIFMYWRYIIGRISNRNLDILLITVPENEAHKTVGKALALLLRQTFKLRVRIDFIDIPETNKKDPYEWINESYAQANHVVFLLSNNTFPNSNIYQDMYNIVLNLIQVNHLNDRKKYSILSFPYSDFKIPPELNVRCRKFELLNNFDDFITYLCSKYILQSFKKDRLLENENYIKLQYEIDHIYEKIDQMHHLKHALPKCENKEDESSLFKNADDEVERDSDIEILLQETI